MPSVLTAQRMGHHRAICALRLSLTTTGARPHRCGRDEQRSPGRTDSTSSAMDVIVTSAADVGSKIESRIGWQADPNVIRLFMDSLTALTFPPLRV